MNDVRQRTTEPVRRCAGQYFVQDDAERVHIDRRCVGRVFRAGELLGRGLGDGAVKFSSSCLQHRLRGIDGSDIELDVLGEAKIKNLRRQG